VRTRSSGQAILAVSILAFLKQTTVNVFNTSRHAERVAILEAKQMPTEQILELSQRDINALDSQSNQHLLFW
jgi:hypothetical protein